jgi:Tol biopolymer transport system component
VSPNGASLAFASNGSLWRGRADGSGRQTLAFGFRSISGIQWSPDSRRILFEGLVGTDSPRAWIVSADGGTPIDIPLGTGHNEPSWCPDSQGIVFAKWLEGTVQPSQTGIYLLDLRNSAIRKIPGSEGLIHPTFSPDGHFLAAVTEIEATPGQPSRLRLFDGRVKAWKEAAQGTLLNPGPWSSDSKHFYYQDILGPEEPVFRLAMSAGRPELSFDFAGLVRAGYVRCAFAGFDTNGKAIAVLTRSESDLYRLDLDLP